MLLALALFILQDPVLPAPDNTPSLPEVPAMPGIPAWQTQLEDLLDLVRDDFQTIQQRLRDARDELDQTPTNEVLQPHLRLAAADADKLLKDMEELLATIPAMDASSSSEGGDPSESNTNPEDTQNNQAGEPKPTQPEGAQESGDGNNPALSAAQQVLFDQQQGNWGALPPRLQEALQNAAVEDLPLRYRRWLDEFHRRRISEE